MTTVAMSTHVANCEKEGHGWHLIKDWNVYVCIDCGKQKRTDAIQYHKGVLG
jgi:hypothetical protein